MFFSSSLRIQTTFSSLMTFKILRPWLVAVEEGGAGEGDDEGELPEDAARLLPAPHLQGVPRTQLHHLTMR